jgi:hypothetical protein
MITQSDWKPIASDTMPPYRTPCLFLHEHTETPVYGELHCYDGKYVAIRIGRHVFVEESLYEFSHWMLWDEKCVPINWEKDPIPS